MAQVWANASAGQSLSGTPIDSAPALLGGGSLGISTEANALPGERLRFLDVMAQRDQVITLGNAFGTILERPLGPTAHQGWLTSDLTDVFTTVQLRFDPDDPGYQYQIGDAQGFDFSANSYRTRDAFALFQTDRRLSFGFETIDPPANSDWAFDYRLAEGSYLLCCGTEDAFGSFDVNLLVSDSNGAFVRGDEIVGRAFQAGGVFTSDFGFLGHAPDNFLYAEIDERLANGGSGTFVFAAGDVDGAADVARFQALQVDRFFISPGLTQAQRALIDRQEQPGFGSDLDAGQRAFLRAETWRDISPFRFTAELTDSGFLVVHPATRVAPEAVTGTPAVLWTSAAIHADFGIGRFGDSQASTISATIGTVDFRQSAAGAASRPVDVDAITRAVTIGSSKAGSATSISLGGPIRSTAAGGGGFLGIPMEFAVFENAGAPSDDTPGAQAETLPGGTERVVGTEDVTRFALSRLAVGAGSAPSARPAGGTAASTGYAAGFVEQPESDGVRLEPFSSAAGDQNLRIAAIGAQDVTMTAEIDRGGTTFELGGAGASAYVDAGTFGARSADGSGAALALDLGTHGVGRIRAGFLGGWFFHSSS